MAKFFDPPQAKPLLPKEKIDKVFKSMRFKVFMGSFLGYAAYYLVRKNLSLASADMIAEGLIDKQGVGIAASAVSIAYAFSKFIIIKQMTDFGFKRIPQQAVYFMDVS